ncbi:ABC transporter permease [Haloarchaeobius amylolyticus]|uniref:ABC transporter permease n=1 Tax=Haloarchaeobius amylolyticus TaxID=1198296 RepID=UPI002271ED18|nr:ABC transporter permease [Haloarchaeobius amylolyticus]
MTTVRRVRSEFVAAWHSFLRRRVAVFFTFFFPVLLIGIFGALVQTNPAGGGLFAEDPAYYVPGYLAVVVLQTPLSRMGSEVARYREGSRFEKLATTPLSRAEWLAAHTLVNTVIIAIAGFVLLVLTVLLTGATVTFSPLILAFVPLGVVCFCGVGSLLGSFADSQDGAITAANAIGLPLLFLSETFVPPSMLPDWFHPIVALSPLTYFAHGLRQAIWAGAESGTVVLGLDAVQSLAVLAVLAVVFFALGARAIPRAD